MSSSTTTATPRLALDPARVERARALAGTVGQPVVTLAQQHTTVSVERATLRLAGLGGADPDGTPWVNRLAEAVRADVGLEHGLALPVWDALLRGDAGDLTGLAQKAGAGSVRFRLPEGGGRRTRGRGVPVGRRRRDRPDRRAARRAGAADRRRRRRPGPAVGLPDRGHRRHPRGHPAGPGRRPGGGRRDRRDPQHRPVAARLRARGRDPRGLRRDLRDAGELPADAGGPRRDLARAGSLHAAHQLRLGPLHARDRGAGGAGAPRHDAQRLDVRDPVPRHQPGPDVRRPAVQPPGARPCRHHHQHRRGQLPHHRRRGRGGPHGHHQPAPQRVLRPRGGARGLAARPRPRLRDRPRRPRLVPARAGARHAGAGALPRRAAEVDATDPPHDRRRLPRLPARRLLQPGRRADRSGHPAGRDDDRGGRDPLALRPGPGPAERPLRHERRRQPPRGLPPGPRRLHRAARRARPRRGDHPARQDRPRPGRRGAPAAAGGDRRRHLRPDEAATPRVDAGSTAWPASPSAYYNPATEILQEGR